MNSSINKSSNFIEGNLVRDKNPDTEGTMIVVEVTGKTSDSVVIDYDWKMNEKMVSDNEYNKQNCSPNDEVIKVVYKNTVEKRYPSWGNKGGVDYLKSLIEQNKLKEFGFPHTRLTSV